MVSADRRIVLAIALFTVLLALFPLLLSEESFVWVFSEAGPFERLSEPAWIVTALIVIFRIRPLGPRAWSFALLCLAFAAREADWHKAFTGESFLKNSFYRDAARPIEDKLICGAIALVLIGLVLGGAAWQAWRLRLGGGAWVATQWLGGVEVKDNGDALWRRLLNVVDEMALASSLAPAATQVVSARRSVPLPW